VRTKASMALAVLAALAIAVGGTCLYVRQELLNSRSFADRTVSALAKAPVRHVASRELVVQVIDKGSPDLLAARPLITTVVDTVVSTEQFRGVVHLAAEQAHRLMFDRGGNVAFSIADAGTVVVSALRTLAPDVAAKIPEDLDAKLLDLRRQSFAVRTLRIADKIRLLGWVLPLVGLTLLALSVAITPRRRLAVTRCAVALAVAGAAVFFDLILLRHATLSHLYGSEELGNADVRAAAGALWDAYLGDLSSWALAFAIFGTIVAAASASLLRPYTAGAGLARLRARLWPPRTPSRQAAGGAIALVFGLLLVGDPTLGLEILGVLGGVLLAYFGVGQVLSAAGAPPEQERPTLRRYRGGLAATAVSLGLLIGGAAVALAVSAPKSSRPPVATALSTCNGYAQLCSKRLDQVVLVGTHNAMSAADSPGWFIANQQHGIAKQLDDGLRTFKISTHYGEGKAGNVRTDIKAEGERANRVSEKLTHEARAALQRFSGSVGFGKAKGKREVWLCHTLCELGATNAVGFFSTIRRFLENNPGNVIALFDEDYVSEASLEDAFKKARLFSHLAVLRAGQQMPTLGQLVRSQHNVLVFTQEPVSGRYPWDMYAFGGFIQDTPLGAVKPKQFTCKLSRGLSSSPLLMMNNWADVFPPRRSPNLPLVKRSFIVKRARQCETERHHIPNLILTDFYDSGDVVGAARVLNGLGEEKPAPIVPVEAGRR
jgi:hypothetical protein